MRGVSTDRSRRRRARPGPTAIRSDRRAHATSARRPGASTAVWCRSRRGCRRHLCRPAAPTPCVLPPSRATTTDTPTIATTAAISTIPPRFLAAGVPPRAAARSAADRNGLVGDQVMTSRHRLGFAQASFATNYNSPVRRTRGSYGGDSSARSGAFCTFRSRCEGGRTSSRSGNARAGVDDGRRSSRSSGRRRGSRNAPAHITVRTAIRPRDVGGSRAPRPLAQRCSAADDDVLQPIDNGQPSYRDRRCGPAPIDERRCRRGVEVAGKHLDRGRAAHLPSCVRRRRGSGSTTRSSAASISTPSVVASRSGSSPARPVVSVGYSVEP